MRLLDQCFQLAIHRLFPVSPEDILLTGPDEKENTFSTISMAK